MLGVEINMRKILGFWGNSTTLIMGYRLKNNDEIIRPIWSYERERQHILFLNQYHKKFQKKKKKASIPFYLNIKYLNKCN